MRRWITGVAALALAAVHLPLLLLIVGSFNASRSGGRWEGFTFGWYRQLVRRGDLLHATGLSIGIGLVATIVSTLVGLAAALALVRGVPSWRRWLEPALLLPIAAPEIVAGISLLILFASWGVHLGLVTVMIAHITFCLPFTLLVMVARLRAMDTQLEAAALLLGATPRRAFRRVTLPLLQPGIIAASLLAFTLSFDDFVITFFTAGPGTTTLPLMVYGMVRRTVEPTVNALSALLVVGTVALLLLVRRVGVLDSGGLS